MTRLTEDQREQLEGLRKLYRSQIPDKVRAIEAAAAQLLEHWETARLSALHELVHRLAGSSAIYGFGDLGRAAAELEDFLGETQGGEHADPNEGKGRLRALVQTLRQASTEEQSP